MSFDPTDAFAPPVVPSKRPRDAPHLWTPSALATPWATPLVPLVPLLPLLPSVLWVDPTRARLKCDPVFPIAGLMREAGGVFQALRRRSESR